MLCFCSGSRWCVGLGLCVLVAWLSGCQDRVIYANAVSHQLHVDAEVRDLEYLSKFRECEAHFAVGGRVVQGPSLVIERETRYWLDDSSRVFTTAWGAGERWWVAIADDAPIGERLDVGTDVDAWVAWSGASTVPTVVSSFGPNARVLGWLRLVSREAEVVTVELHLRADPGWGWEQKTLSGVEEFGVRRVVVEKWVD